MIRRPPRSTLFPYRRSSDLETPNAAARCNVPAPQSSSRFTRSVSTQRSEEHTSELQSQSNLVCRLLLEKKKTTSVTPMERCRLRPNFGPPCQTSENAVQSLMY